MNSTTIKHENNYKTIINYKSRPKSYVNNYKKCKNPTKYIQILQTLISPKLSKVQESSRIYSNLANNRHQTYLASIYFNVIIIPSNTTKKETNKHFTTTNSHKTNFEFLTNTRIVIEDKNMTHIN